MRRLRRCPIRPRTARAALALSAFTLTHCGSGDTAAKEKAQALVENTFAAAVKPGPFATEALGKGVWYRADAINGGCLQTNEWGHIDDPAHSPGGGGVRRISPKFDQQKFWTGRTEKGWCIYLGNDLRLEVKQVNFVGDAWVVDYAFTMDKPDGWWQCVDEKKREGYVRVKDDGAGNMTLEGDVVLHQGACPSPLPLVDMARNGKSRPSAKPPGAPSKADAIAAAKRLDDALWEGDFQAAKEATACYNLYAKDMFDSCVPGDFLNLGPIPRGGAPRMSDGPPWSMNAFRALEDLGKPEKDKSDATIYHVEVAPAKGKAKRRTLAIQWVDGEWKVLAVIGRLAEGLTSPQVLYDLDRSDRRDIFERRLKGEAIGDDGLPLDAGVRYGYTDPE